jgi:hypothetical protein
MEIREVSFSDFRALLGDSVADIDHPGCAWYASADRRVAAKLFIDPDSEQWRHSTYHLFRCEWIRRDSRGFEHFDDAVGSLNRTLRNLTLHRVQVADAKSAKLRPTQKNHSAAHGEAAETSELPLERK